MREWQDRRTDRQTDPASLWCVKSEGTGTEGLWSWRGNAFFERSSLALLEVGEKALLFYKLSFLRSNAYAAARSTAFLLFWNGSMHLQLFWSSFFYIFHVITCFEYVFKISKFLLFRGMRGAQ